MRMGRWFALATILMVVSQEGAAQSLTSAAEDVGGQTISLDLKGVDVLDVLKLLSQQSGLNFVAGRNVSGRVTMFAKEVEVWEAFERLIETNELAYERRGSLVTVMTAKEYEDLYGVKFQERTQTQMVTLAYAKAAVLATLLNQLKSSIGRIAVDEGSNTVILTDTPTRLEDMRSVISRLDQATVTRVYPLNYAQAEKLTEQLREILTPGVGMMSIDPRTNTMLVTDLERALLKVDQMVKAFDVQEGEVLIEAKIVKVELNDEQSLGIDWQRAFSGVDTRVRANFRLLSDIVDGSATGTALKFLSAPSGEAQVVVEALKKFGKVETVANPRIAVLNNQEAKILVGTKEAFVTVTTTIPTTGSVVTSPQIQFVDVGTKLFVTPSVKADGHVQLKIRPEVSTAKVETFQSNRIPIVSTTEAETTVLVRSGATLIIGGLIDTKTERTKSQVPLLGNMPLLGALFSSSVDVKKKSELVVFLSPQIISTHGTPLTSFPASSGEANDPTVPEGYQALIRALLSSQLAQRLRSSGAGEGSLTYAFTLDRRGHLIGTPDISSPQGAIFIEAAREALRTVLPLPPFPEALTAPRAHFRLAVEYHPPD